MGKTNILSRFVNERFIEFPQPTITQEFYSKQVEVDGRRVTLRLWDTAGQEMFRAMTHSFYRKCDGAIVCYDVTRKRTFNKVDFWISEIRENSRGNVPVILVANKTDLEDQREVKQDDGLFLAKAKELFFMETSAKTNEGRSVNVAFETIIREALRCHEEGFRGDMASELRYSLRVPRDDSEESGDEGTKSGERHSCC